MALYRHQAERELQTISLQASAVSDWRERRLADASALKRDSLFAQAVAAGATSIFRAETPVHDRLRILQERALRGGVFRRPRRALLLPAGSSCCLRALEQEALKQALERNAERGGTQGDPFLPFRSST